jgi:hypothetical protein
MNAVPIHIKATIPTPNHQTLHLPFFLEILKSFNILSAHSQASIALMAQEFSSVDVNQSEAPTPKPVDDGMYS